MEGKEEIAISWEQSVGVEEGWKIKLERREAASLGRALPAGWAETSGCHPRD